MTIDLGENKKDILHIFEYDDPYLKASEFCKMHNLNEQAVKKLAYNIEVNK